MGKGKHKHRAKQVMPVNSSNPPQPSTQEAFSDISGSGDTEEGSTREQAQGITLPAAQLENLKEIVLTEEELESSDITLQLIQTSGRTLDAPNSIPTQQKNALRDTLSRIKQFELKNFSKEQISKLNHDLIKLQSFLLQIEKNLSYQTYNFRINVAGLICSFIGTILTGYAAYLLSVGNSSDKAHQSEDTRSALLAGAAATGLFTIGFNLIKNLLESGQQSSQIAADRTDEIRQFTQIHTSALLIMSDKNHTGEMEEVPEPTYKDLYHNLIVVQGMLASWILPSDPVLKEKTQQTTELMERLSLHLNAFYTQNNPAQGELEIISKIIEDIIELANETLKMSSSSSSGQPSSAMRICTELTEAARKAQSCAQQLSQITQSGFRKNNSS